jgi:hypothetical protein
LRFGVEVSPRATITEIVAEAQKEAEERLEDAKFYTLYQKGRPTLPPWTQANYELKPNVPLATVVTAKTRNGDITVAVPINHPEAWQQVVYQAIVDPPLSLHQTGPNEFTAFYESQIETWKVRFVQGDEGEEHDVNMLPNWQNQIIRVREAFGREMIPDDSHPAEDGVIFVKSANGSPPDPTSERVIRYTFGNDPMEYHVRIHGGDSPATIREGLKILHPGKNPAE